MNAPLHQLLAQQLNQATGQTLWLVDENLSAAETNAIRPRPALSAVTNRYDVCNKLASEGISVTLSDFDLAGLPAGQYQSIIYRVSKERALVHHCINQAFRLLVDDGALIMLGGKQDGLQTNARSAGAVFGSKAHIKKHGTHYVATIRKAAGTPQEILDSNDYPQLRHVETDEANFLSKPGIFGWSKVDQGSALLVETLRQQLDPSTAAELSVLDLGCGYGYLLLATRDLPFALRTATDNNAAAVAATQANLAAAQIQARITLDDCGANLQDRFDLILCNPPFHHGFGASRDLTVKFLGQINRLLAPQGKALLVVNQFIPLEVVAAEYFGSVELAASNVSFKVIVLKGPRRRQKQA